MKLAISFYICFKPMAMAEQTTTSSTQDTQKENKSNRAVVVILVVMIALLGITGVFLTVKYVQSSKRIEALESENVRLNDHVNEREAELERISTELDSLKSFGLIPQSTVDSLQSIITELEADLEQAKKQRIVVPGSGGTSKRIAELEAEVENWRQKWTTMEAERNKLLDENKKLTGDVNAANQQNQDLQMRNRDMQQKLDLASGLKIMGATLTGYREKKNGEKLYEEKVKRMAGMEVQFSIMENVIAESGDRTAYIVITGPNKKVLAESSDNTFEYLGIEKVYSVSKEFYYGNKEIELTADFKTSEKLASGEYRAEVFIDGALAGYCSAVFR